MVINRIETIDADDLVTALRLEGTAAANRLAAWNRSLGSERRRLKGGEGRHADTAAGTFNRRGSGQVKPRFVVALPASIWKYGELSRPAAAPQCWNR